MQGMRRDMEGATGAPQAAMAEQELEPPQVNARFPSGRGERMTTHGWVDGLRQVRGLPGLPADQIHGLGGHRARARVAGTEPRLRFVLLPILS